MTDENTQDPYEILLRLCDLLTVTPPPQPGAALEGKPITSLTMGVGDAGEALAGGEFRFIGTDIWELNPSVMGVVAKCRRNLAAVDLVDRGADTVAAFDRVLAAILHGDRVATGGFMLAVDPLHITRVVAVAGYWAAFAEGAAHSGDLDGAARAMALMAHNVVLLLLEMAHLVRPSKDGEVGESWPAGGVGPEASPQDCA